MISNWYELKRDSGRLQPGRLDMRVGLSAFVALAALAIVAGWMLTRALIGSSGMVSIRNAVDSARTSTSSFASYEEKLPSSLIAAEVVVHKTPTLGNTVLTLAEDERTVIEWSDLVSTPLSSTSTPGGASISGNGAPTVVGSPTVGDIDCDGQADVVIGMLSIGIGGARGIMLALSPSPHPYDTPRRPDGSKTSSSRSEGELELSPNDGITWRTLWKVDMYVRACTASVCSFGCSVLERLLVGDALSPTKHPLGIAT